MIMRILMYPVFHLWLKHLIRRNYRLREIAAIFREYGIPAERLLGKDYPDQWYWADSICSRYGYFVVERNNGRPIVEAEQWTETELEAIRRQGRQPLVINYIKGKDSHD